jgi:hypothetical protein
LIFLPSYRFLAGTNAGVAFGLDLMHITSASSTERRIDWFNPHCGGVLVRSKLDGVA